MNSQNLEIRRYLKWYAIQDLFAPIERKVTLVMCGTFGCSLFLLVLAGTAALAMPKIEEQRIKSALLARSIWVGQMNNIDKHFTEERLGLLRSVLKAHLPQNVPTVSGFFEVSLSLSVGNTERFQRFFGRTISGDDPLLSDLSQRVPEVDNGFSGIIVSDGLLDLLKLSGDTKIDLRVRLNDNSPEPIVVEVPCHRVAGLRLPNGHCFLIREEAWAKLFRDCYPPTASSFVLQFPWDEFTKLEELLADSEEFRDCMSGLSAMPSSGMLRLSSDEHQPVWQWESKFTRLTDLISQHGIKGLTPREKWTPHADDLTPTEWSRPSTGFHNAEVRVATVEDLSNAAAACREAGYPADDVLVQQVKNVQESGRVLRFAILAIDLVVLISGVVVVAALQHLRWRQKSPESGMLRILGMTNRELRVIRNHQSLILSLGSILVATFISAFVFCTFILPFFPGVEIDILIRCAVTVGIAACIAAIVLIYAALQLATQTACSISPLSALLGSAA